MSASTKQIADLTLTHGFPTMYRSKDLPRADGLFSYGISLIVANRWAAFYVDRILKGEKPADLPVE